MNRRRPRVLVVDDEPEIRKYVSIHLGTQGYHVLTAADGTEALKLAAEEVLDLIITDISMPGSDGFAVCEAVRRDSAVPIIVLSSHGQERDKVRALDAGADDYLTKPFGAAELLARVRAVMRRATKSDGGPLPPVLTDDLEIDFVRRRVRARGEEVSLTPTEYNLLAYMVRNAGKALTRRDILQSVWGPEYGEEHDYLWAYVRRLRRKLESDPHHPRHVLTEPRVGYRFELQDHS